MRHVALLERPYTACHPPPAQLCSLSLSCASAVPRSFSVPNHRESQSAKILRTAQFSPASFESSQLCTPIAPFINPPPARGQTYISSHRWAMPWCRYLKCRLAKVVSCNSVGSPNIRGCASGRIDLPHSHPSVRGCVENRVSAQLHVAGSFGHDM